MRIDFSRGVASLALATASVLMLGAQTAGAAVLLAVDVNDRTPIGAFGSTDGSTTDSGTQAGYSSYLLGPTGGTTGVTSTSGVTQAVGDGYSLNLATALAYPVGGGTGTLNDIDRNFTFPSTLTNAELYDDFVYNASNTGGIRVTISGGNGAGALQPDTQYLVSIYSYDHGSPGSRTAQYTDLNNANAPVLTTSFVGGVVPTTDETYKFTGTAITDANGVLSLLGTNTTAMTGGLPSTFGLYISGLEVATVPEPTAALGLVTLAGLLMGRRRGAK